VRLQTDEGVEGIGLATSYTPIEAAIHAFRSGIGELIIGADALAPEQLYRKLFALTWQRLAHEKAGRARRWCASPPPSTSRFGTSWAKWPACLCTGCSAAFAARYPPTSPAPITATART